MDRETAKKLQSTLSAAESELQQLIAESSIAGDYAGVRNAAKVAEFWAARPAHRSGLGSEQAKWEAFRPRKSDTNPYILDVLKQAERAFRRLKRQAVDRADGAAVHLTRQHARLVRGIAGRFVQVRQPKNDWSKTENCEYVHRVTLTAYRNTLNALENLGRNAQGPLKSSRIHQEVQRICHVGIRSHEIYTVLGMLKEQGIIESTGADLFLIPSNVGVVAQTALSA